MPWNSPIPLERVLALVPSVSSVVDLGCGSGELLGALGRGTGVDRDEASITTAQERWPHLDWVCGDAGSVEGTFELAICLGSTHAFGMGEAALTGACRFMAGLGASYLLIGEGYQKQPLAPAYAELLGPNTGIERTHLQNVRAIEAQGFDVQMAITATDAEWDAFEWAFYRRRGDRTWRDAWLEHGRATMGFGVYLARRV